MKSKMLGALALFTLIGALFILQSAGTGPPTVNAATGSIDALNVGTCLTTDATVFDGDCHLVQSGANGWEIRDENVEVSTLYATYAHDPKTASEEPRAILMNSDLIQISIADSGRDKRTGVLIEGSGVTAPDTQDAETTPNTYTALAAINGFLERTSDNQIDWKTQADNPSLRDAVRLEVGQDGNTFFTTSGVQMLNFADADGGKYAPMDIGGTIRFFGCISADPACVVDNDGGDPEVGEFQELKAPTIDVDEDKGAGKNGGTVNTAPWLQVLASVGTQVNIFAIYYETSDVEYLDGGEKYWTCADGSTPTNERVGTPPTDSWRCGYVDASDEGTQATPTDGAANVDYTDNEKDNNTALRVEASADGDTRAVNLKLTETGRFDGAYQGFLRLTDADGDGRIHSSGGTTRDNWGLEIGEGTRDNPAVLGVESGPVTITYRDSDDNTQTLRIEIDNRAPSIDITSPANGSSSNDRSPDFIGSFEDADSGLVDRSFRLVVDNDVDGNDGKNGGFALSETLDAPKADEVDGSGTDGMGKVTHIGEYTGYDSDADMTVGVTSAMALYNLGNDSCDDATCYIEAEEHDDGANRGTFDDSVRLNLQERNSDADTRDREFEIDFQAFVMDMAGNIGFSDSDRANPRFINAWGEDDAGDRGPTGDEGEKHNVLGYYSAHIITLDDKDPEIMQDDSATGFYGLNADGDMIPDRTGIMVAFDGPLDSSTVSTSTFAVELAMVPMRVLWMSTSRRTMSS